MMIWHRGCDVSLQNFDVAGRNPLDQLEYGHVTVIIVLSSGQVILDEDSFTSMSQARKYERSLMPPTSLHLFNQS